MKKCGIYGIFNMADGKVLVGSSVHICRRWNHHKWTARHGNHVNKYFQRAWNKYGELLFEFRILEECFISSLLPREDYWMDFYRSTNPLYGYNLHYASRIVFSEETKRKISQSKIGKKMSIEAKKNISEGHRRTKHWNYGKHHSIKTRKKISESHKGSKNWWFGRHHSAEQCKKISEAQKGLKNHNYGKVPSQEHRNKISKANKGHVPWNKGRTGFYHHSKEIRRKISESRKGQ